ncbi:MAG: FAD-dependent oxidoreductase [Myxococcales bacterium]|nr:FAD-dependent oxidoreductase [Myxococcales bacterium]
MRSGWTRRGLLRALAAALAAPALAGCSGGPRAASAGAKPVGETRSVIVVGAGIAGLAAAQRLIARGVERVVVLEARDRIGGRLHSVTRDGMTYDMGASWLHGIDSNPLVALVDDLGLRRVVTDYDARTDYDRSGREVDDDYEDRLTALLEAIEALAEAGPDRSLREVFDEALRRSGASATEAEIMRYALNVEVECEFGASADALSAQCFDEGVEYEGDDAIIPAGYSRLAESLAAGLDVRLGQVVTAVEVLDGGVEITANGEVFLADRAIITLPHGVLQAGVVEFSPVLSSAKLRAIGRLHSGLLQKVWLRFDEAFWHEAGDDVFIGYRGGDGRFEEWLDLSAVPGLEGTPVLLALNAGTVAEAYEAMTDDAIVADAMQALRVIFGDDIPVPSDALVSRWGQDAFSRGAYSSLGVGACREDRVAMAAIEHGRLHFAGEATSVDNPSSAQGAWASGLRAADEVS